MELKNNNRCRLGAFQNGAFYRNNLLRMVQGEKKRCLDWFLGCRSGNRRVALTSLDFFGSVFYQVENPEPRGKIERPAGEVEVLIENKYFFIQNASF